MAIIQPDLPAGAAHNLFLDAGIEGSILSLAAVALWAIWNLRGFWDVLWSQESSLQTDLAFGLQLSGVAFLIYTAVQSCPFYYYGVGAWMALWFTFPVFARVLMNSHRMARL
jgi:O-antigen ligase